MSKDVIKVKGARVHNLKNIDVDIPRGKLVVITGLSGSGKSSLAFDTLYAEGQRRYVESLSAYARQFLGVMQKPDVDKIENISPAIAIDQRKAAHNPRSTVGTITEIYDYLRLLFARSGTPHCPKCGKEVSRQTVDQIIEQILNLPKKEDLIILAPLVRGKKGQHQSVLQEVDRGGFIRIRFDGVIQRIEEALQLDIDRNVKHTIDVVVDRLHLGDDIERSRLADSLETALKLGKGHVMVSQGEKDTLFSEHFACEECGISLPELEPRLFSFNSPFGACQACQGLGERLEVDTDLVVPNRDLSIAEGAIRPWMHASHKIGRQRYFWRQLSKLAARYDFSLDEPIKKLPAKIFDVIMQGDDKFEGVIPQLERRHRETESEYTREEIEQYMTEHVCEACEGRRLRPEVLAVTVGDKTIDDVVSLPLAKAAVFFKDLKPELTTSGVTPGAVGSEVVAPIVREIKSRLQFLIDVGLDYLTLSRKAGTLSGGEQERIRLATQIGSQLSGVLYILDEPSIGLHARDQDRLIKTLTRLRDLGNTVLVVEHDAQTIVEADYIIDIGPGAGKHGGEVVFAGTAAQIRRAKTLTGQYLSGKKEVAITSRAQKAKTTKEITIKGATEHNLKNVDVSIPLGKFVCVTGVSGSGKSTLVSDILARALLRKFYNAKDEPGEYKKLVGVGNINKVVRVDQSPIGRTPRSNPATYTGTFSAIRDVFAKTKEAKARGFQPGRFSFNVKGGRCEACEGQGTKKVEMYFLPDIYVECQECKGKRYNKETLEVRYRDKTIADVLGMTVEEALIFFKNISTIHTKLETLHRVGLDYVELGQPAPSLSGGEAQRVKLATELAKRATGKTLYILDEPTTGLHFADIQKLLHVVRDLVGLGNTVLTIEHNLDVIKNADWIIDLGPEGGEHGGTIVAEGSPKKIAQSKKSHTGKYLKQVLS